MWIRGSAPPLSTEKIEQSSIYHYVQNSTLVVYFSQNLLEIKSPIPESVCKLSEIHRSGNG